MIIFIAIKVRSPAKVFFVFSLPQNIVLSRKSFILNLHYNNNRLLGANAFISWNLYSAWTLSTFGCDGSWRKRTTFPRLAQAAELVHHPSSTFIICKTETNEASAPISEHERQSSIMPLWAKYHGAMGVLFKDLPLLFSAAVLSFSWSWNVRIVFLPRRAAEAGVWICDSSETTWHRSRRSSRRASERLIDQTDRPMTQLKAKPPASPSFILNPLLDPVVTLIVSFLLFASYLYKVIYIFCKPAAGNKYICVWAIMFLCECTWVCLCVLEYSRVPVYLTGME